jgi:hypothetical protein
MRTRHAAFNRWPDTQRPSTAFRFRAEIQRNLRGQLNLFVAINDNRIRAKFYQRQL